MRGLALLAVAAALASSAQAREERFYGYAVDRSNGRYLYTEVHHHRYDGDRWLGGRIRYVAADGTEFGHKTLDFSADPCIPVYRLELPQERYAEGIVAVGADTVSLFKQQASSPQPQSRRLALRQPAAADSGFHVLLQRHFAPLLRGETLSFSFIAAGRLDAYRFRVRRIADTDFEGRPAVQLQVEPDSLLRMFVAPLQLAYDAGTRKLLEYRGLSNVHDPATGEPWDVKISFYSRPPAGAPSLPPLD